MKRILFITLALLCFCAPLAGCQSKRTTTEQTTALPDLGEQTPKEPSDGDVFMRYDGTRFECAYEDGTEIFSCSVDEIQQINGMSGKYSSNIMWLRDKESIQEFFSLLFLGTNEYCLERKEANYDDGIPPSWKGWFLVAKKKPLENTNLNATYTFHFGNPSPEQLSIIIETANAKYIVTREDIEELHTFKFLI